MPLSEPCPAVFFFQFSPSFYTNRKSYMNETIKAISEIFKIKLTRTRERFASAFGFSSYNHLSAHLLEHHSIGVSFECFSERLATELLEHHQIVMNQDHVKQLRGLSNEMSDVYNATYFYTFYRFSLLINHQLVPLHSLDFIDYFESVSIKNKTYDGCGNYDGLNDLLHEYLETDVAPLELIDAIKILLKESRRLSKDNLLYTFRSNKGGDFHIKNYLRDFKKCITKYVNPDPIFYYATITASTNPYLIGSTINVDTSSTANQLYAGIGEAIRPLHEFIQDSKGDCFDFSNKHTLQPLSSFEDVCDFELVPNTILMSPLKSGMQSGNVFGALGEFHVTLTEDSNPIPKEFHLEMFGDNDGDNDGDDDDDINFGALPIVVIGNPLTNAVKNQFVTTIRACNNDNELLFSRIVNTVSLVEDCDVSALLPRVIGELIGEVLKAKPDHIVNISNIREGIYTTLSKDEIKNPFGFDEIGMATRFLQTCGSGRYKNDVSAGLLEIKKGAEKILKRKINTLDTYTDNLKKYSYMGVLENGDRAYFIHDEIDAQLFDLDEETIQYFNADKGLASHLPLQECRNLYIITLDNRCNDNKHFIAGFNKLGRVIINGVYTPFDVNCYSADDYVRLAAMYRSLSESIQGHLYQYDLEMPFGDDLCYDHVSEGLWDFRTENDFVKHHFPVFNNEGCGELTIEVYIKDSKGIVLNDTDEVTRILADNPYYSLERNRTEVEKELFLKMDDNKKTSVCSFGLHTIKKTSVNGVFTAKTDVLFNAALFFGQSNKEVSVGKDEYQVIVKYLDSTITPTGTK